MSVSTLPSKSVSPDASDGPSGPRDNTVAAAEVCADGRSFTAPRIVGLLVLSLIPFWAVPVAHIASNPDTATGLFHYELPYYVANGRAAFERGNGIFYPNPYDPSPNAPAIYAHWLPWIFGLLTAKSGFDPGDLILAFTFFASLAFAAATRQLVLLRIHPPRAQGMAFLFAMWGGGLLCAAGTLVGLAGSASWLESVLQFDPGRGMWFLNWGRNALFPTEAIYHALVAGCWVAEIRRRPVAANTCLLLLAATHPWSGLELLVTINLWRGMRYLRQPDRGGRNQLCLSVLTLAVFLGYYKIWLPSFPQHARLQSVWELNWSLSRTSAVLAYLPVWIPCCVLVRRWWHSRSLSRCEQFLLCALAVAAGLAFHDRFIKPVQPLHFTRGYVWLPMFLLGLPILMEWWAAARRRSSGLALAAVSAAAVLMADNLIFSAVHCQRQFSKQDGFHLDGDERALLGTLHEGPVDGTRIVLTESATVNYLLPTFANARPWLGHHFNTPDFPERQATWERCFPDNFVDTRRIPAEVDLVVIRRSRNATELMRDPRWSPRDLKNGEWAGWRASLPQQIES